MWDGLRFMDHPKYLFDGRLPHQRGDAQTNLRHFMHERHRETLPESWQNVCRRSVCSCAERRTHATRWSCARWSDLSSDRRTRCFLQTVAVGGGVCSRLASRMIPSVCDARHQCFLKKTWRGAQSHRNRVSRVLSETGVPVHRSTFVRVGLAPVSFGGALEVHTSTFFSRTDTPVALREGETLEIHVGRLAFHGSPEVFI